MQLTLAMTFNLITCTPCPCAQVISSQTADVEIKAKAATEKEENLKTESTQISLDKVRYVSDYFCYFCTSYRDEWFQEWVWV